MEMEDQGLKAERDAEEKRQDLKLVQQHLDEVKRYEISMLLS